MAGEIDVTCDAETLNHRRWKDPRDCPRLRARAQVHPRARARTLCEFFIANGDDDEGPSCSSGFSSSTTSSKSGESTLLSNYGGGVFMRHDGHVEIRPDMSFRS